LLFDLLSEGSRGCVATRKSPDVQEAIRLTTGGREPPLAGALCRPGMCTVVEEGVEKEGGMNHFRSERSRPSDL